MNYSQHDIQINLLPWRSEKRKADRSQFLAFCGLTVVLAVLVAFLVYSVFSSQSAGQEYKNQYLTKEIAVLKKQIDKISKLKEQTESLLARKRIIESLNATRSESVFMFSELHERIPDGVFVTKLTQKELRVHIEGIAQSSTRVSAFMKGLSDSELFENPHLNYVKAKDVNKKIVHEFSMDISIARSIAEDTDKAKKGDK